MDTSYISAFAALAGTAIGGLASFATSWVTQQAQSRAQRSAAERDFRAALFGRFLDEAAKLYSDALQTSRDDVTGLIQIYALTNRIRLLSSPEVVEAADTVVRIIVDTYLAPNITLHEMRDELDRQTCRSVTGFQRGVPERTAGVLTPPSRRAERLGAFMRSSSSPVSPTSLREGRREVARRAQAAVHRFVTDEA